MKADQKASKTGITGPVLQDLIERQKTDSKLRNPEITETPLQPSALFQNDGGSYNAQFIFPQE